MIILPEEHQWYKSITTPWGPIGYLTYKRTYARRRNPDDINSPTEELPESVSRVIMACRTQLGVGFTKEEEDELAYYLLTLKGSVAGRFWWQMGTDTVNRLGLLSLQNCAFTNIDHPIRPFTWAMDALMLGSGVGFNIQKHNISKLPIVHKATITRQDNADAQYIISDNREGWVALLGKVLKAHFYGTGGFTYSTQLIRGKGAPIKGFGGTASGPEELCWGIGEISKVLNKRAGGFITSVDALDIMNIIGEIVVAGNVRRSAQIAIGDPDDVEYLKAKRWDLKDEKGNPIILPKWRANSNNSVAASATSELAPEFWETYELGEPYGMINIVLAQAIGRIGEYWYPDPKVRGFNPCAEQGLADKETCCLAEIFLPNITSAMELFNVAKLLYRVCKHSLSLPCHLKETEAIVHELMRMGIGITGVLEASQEQLSWLYDVYELLRQYDVEYSEKHGWPTSVKLTTVKPSGTLSLLAGVTPGAHPSPAGPFYIRRVRMAADSYLVQVCRDHGYHVEWKKNLDGTTDHNTVVVEFPCKVPEGTKVAGSISAVEHLEIVKWLQANWSDNSVSCTIYYTKEEIPAIKAWLDENYTLNVKTVSFLLYHGHGFVQAPYETITEDRYNELMAITRQITSIASVGEDELVESAECAGGACPVK